MVASGFSGDNVAEGPDSGILPVPVRRKQLAEYEVHTRLSAVTPLDLLMVLFERERASSEAALSLEKRHACNSASWLLSRPGGLRVRRRDVQQRRGFVVFALFQESARLPLRHRRRRCGRICA